MIDVLSLEMAITLDAKAPSAYFLWIEEPYSCTKTQKVLPHLEEVLSMGIR
jgi:hypothetical protein